MLSLISPGSSSHDPAVSSVMQLLTLLADPQQAQAKLQELQTAAQKVNDDRAAADLVIAEANHLLDEAKKRVSESAEYDAQTKDRRKDLDLTIKLFSDEQEKFRQLTAEFENKRSSSESGFKEREAFLSRAESALSDRTKAFDAAYSEKQASLAIAQTEIDRALSNAHSLEEEYKTKIDALRKLAA